MITRSRHLASICAAALIAGTAASLPHTAQAQSTPLTYEQSYCIGMAGVTAATMQMRRMGGRSWQQIHQELTVIVRQSEWPLDSTGIGRAMKIGDIGALNGDDPRSVAPLIIRECLTYAWYAN